MLILDKSMFLSTLHAYLRMQICITYRTHVWVCIRVVGEKLILSFQPISDKLVIDELPGLQLVDSIVVAMIP